MIDQTFHLIGVMGWPVMHSRSPLMHNYWFDQSGLPGKYVYLPLPPDRLPAALRALPALNFAGCNLTIPHKLHAMEIVDEVDEVARKIGAISCVVVRDDGSLWGTNNDWRGFLGNLKQSVPGWRADAGIATVIGAGGGARGHLPRAAVGRCARNTSGQSHPGSRRGTGRGYRWPDHHSAMGSAP